jgi:hypothetical protein
MFKRAITHEKGSARGEWRLLHYWNGAAAYTRWSLRSNLQNSSLPCARRNEQGRKFWKIHPLSAEEQFLFIRFRLKQEIQIKEEALQVAAETTWLGAVVIAILLSMGFISN